VDILVLWPSDCKNVQKNLEMMASGRENELKKMAGLGAVDDVLSAFGSDEKSCFPIIMVEKRILAEACIRHP
jgi:hypothetical protein